MRELIRQLLAGGLASVAFLGLFFGANLVWWLALLLTGLVFGGVLLLFPRMRLADQVEVADGVTQADLNQAVRMCHEAAAELELLSREEKLSREISDAFRRLAEIVNDIAADYRRDPRDIRHSRSFTDHHLQAVREIAQGYVHLSRARLNVDADRRLREIRARILGYVESFDAVYHACLANDFRQLEISTAALDQIMKVEIPTSVRS
jgi:chemotaxis regulatin CheY-phosphate phosphatase CheZ